MYLKLKLYFFFFFYLKQITASLPVQPPRWDELLVQDGDPGTCPHDYSKWTPLCKGGISNVPLQALPLRFPRVIDLFRGPKPGWLTEVLRGCSCGN